MPPPAVVVEVRQGAMWIRLNRPEAMNALTLELLNGIDQALNEAEKNPEVRAVVLTGAGRAFCAGADLKYVRAQSDPDGPRRFLDCVLTTMNRLDSFPKPVIAALNGLALAGGLELVLCCDLVLAARPRSAMPMRTTVCCRAEGARFAYPASLGPHAPSTCFSQVTFSLRKT